MITSKMFHELAQASTNVNNVVAFKIAQGIEFIARVGASSDDLIDTVVLDRVRLLNIQYDNRQQVVAQLIPFSNSNPDATITFSLKDVIAVYTPVDEVEKDYINSTTTIDLMGS